MRFTLLYCTETSWSSEIFSEIRSRKKEEGKKDMLKNFLFPGKLERKMQGGTFLGFAALKVSSVLYKNPEKEKKEILALHYCLFTVYVQYMRDIWCSVYIGM